MNFAVKFAGSSNRSFSVYLMNHIFQTSAPFNIWMWNVQNLTLEKENSPCDFSKNASFKERMKTCFFVTFNIILSHIFPENYIEFTQVVQKIWRVSVAILAIFINFFIFFIFWRFLVTKKLVKSAYNRWCHHFFLLSTYFKLIV